MLRLFRKEKEMNSVIKRGSIDYRKTLNARQTR